MMGLPEGGISLTILTNISKYYQNWSVRRTQTEIPSL